MDILGKNQSTRSIDLKDRFTGERYRGEFTFKCLLTNGETLEAAKTRDKLLGGSQTMPAGYQYFTEAVANLDIRILAAPDWWKRSDGGLKFTDPEIVTKLYEESLLASAEYIKALKDSVDAAEKAQTEKERSSES
jgi:hypothetical protein